MNAASSNITPLRSLDSSSSDVGLASPSSPLSRLQPGKTIMTRREQECQATGRSRQYHEDQLSLEEESPSHRSSTVSIGAAQCKESPLKNIPMSVRGILSLSQYMSSRKATGPSFNSPYSMLYSQNVFRVSTRLTTILCCQLLLEVVRLSSWNWRSVVCSAL